MNIIDSRFRGYSLESRAHAFDEPLPPPRSSSLVSKIVTKTRDRDLYDMHTHGGRDGHHHFGRGIGRMRFGESLDGGRERSRRPDRSGSRGQMEMGFMEDTNAQRLDI